jgi:hypothetical protein
MFISVRQTHRRDLTNRNDVAECSRRRPASPKNGGQQYLACPALMITASKPPLTAPISGVRLIRFGQDAAW